MGGSSDKTASIKQVIERHQLKRSETLFIGDMKYDVLQGKKAKVVTAAVLTGYQSCDQLSSVLPDFILPNLKGLPLLVGGMHGQR
jgi:phosphoglycolate phosphatase